MAEEREQINFRATAADKAKLERMRVRSRRTSIQNVLEALVAMANEQDPAWNVVPVTDEHQSERGPAA